MSSFIKRLSGSIKFYHDVTQKLLVNNLFHCVLALGKYSCFFFGFSLITLYFTIFRVTITETGNLKILETLPTDSGLFRCVGSNIAGERQSRAAALIVLRRPHFVVKPSNVTALVGQTVEFNCQVS